jgi:hypothetical protein
MTDISNENPLRIATAHQLALKNRNCIYCGDPLTKAIRTREHVIARNFVPKGTLDLNLIGWACRDCNGTKSDLEDDISLISMLPALGERLPPDDKRIPEIARKAKNAVSRRTGKPVKDSRETFTVRGEVFPGLTMKAELISNPQTDPERVRLLAMYHLQAFFYLTTYNKETRTGARLPGIFMPIGHYRRSDWGNARLRAFISNTKDWDPRLIMRGKGAFFRIVTRRKLPRDLWSWAVEWNRTLRVIGFFGAEELVNEAAANLPKLKMKEMGKSDKTSLRMRTEEPLPEAEDTLFEINEEIQ